LGSGARKIRNIVGEHTSTSVLKYVLGQKKGSVGHLLEVNFLYLQIGELGIIGIVMRKKIVQNQKKMNSLKIQENIGFLNGSLVKGPTLRLPFKNLKKPRCCEDFWMKSVKNLGSFKVLARKTQQLENIENHLVLFFHPKHQRKARNT
jgi:hypothetical protein